MFFSGVSVAGSPDVPNEDWVAATSNLTVMLDGATSRTATGCRHGIAWYTRRLGAAIIGHGADWSNALPQALAKAIGEVAALHPECDLAHPGTPSAAVAIVRFESEWLRYLVLGDVTLVLDINGCITTVSDPRISTSAPQERREVDRHLIGSPEKAAALVVMKHAELAARNTQDGYWIAAADPAAAQYAITGELPRSTVQRLALFTDGAARGVDLFGATNWTSALDLLRQCGPQWFVDKLVRPIEAADPLGARYPRNKCSDDATVVFARLAGVSDAAEWPAELTPHAWLDVGQG